MPSPHSFQTRCCKHVYLFYQSIAKLCPSPHPCHCMSSSQLSFHSSRFFILMLFIFPIPSHFLSFIPPRIFLHAYPPVAPEPNAQITFPPPFYSPLNLSFFPLCWAWIFHSPHQICIPLIKLNYSRLPNIRCRWLSTQDARLWTSNDTASLSAELQPSERRPRARHQRPSSMPKPWIKYRFLFPPAF